MTRRFPDRVAKLVGSDTEFANFIEGVDVKGGTAKAAVRLLLHEVDGPPAGKSFRRVPAWTTNSAVWRYSPDRGALSIIPNETREGWSAGNDWWSTARPSGDMGYDPQDVGRRFQLSNGGCVYEDLSHYEACIPEVLSASDFTAAIHATFLAARTAAELANEKLTDDRRVMVLANNTDGVVSWGAHFNIATSRQTFGAIVDKVYPNAFFLGAYQASSQLFTGQGKVGAANGRAWCDFQISQRADFIESFFSHSTTSHRPLVNARDEAHCGGGNGLARLHIINFDHTLQQVATYLKCGATQLVVAMIEAGWVDRDLILEDPVAAMQTWSRDPDLNTTATTVGGRSVTLVEHQLLIAECAARFVAEGEADAFVPEAKRIVNVWEETLAFAERKDFVALAGRLDWALKRLIFERALTRRDDLDWRSPEIKHLDLIYSSVLDDGLYFRNARNLENVVTPGKIERFLHEPPDDTRAWARAHLLRAAQRENIEVVSVDWDKLTFKMDSGWNGARRCVQMPDPFGHTRRVAAQYFESATSFNDLLDLLTANHVVDEETQSHVSAKKHS